MALECIEDLFRGKPAECSSFHILTMQVWPRRARLAGKGAEKLRVARSGQEPTPNLHPEPSPDGSIQVVSMAEHIGHSSPRVVVQRNTAQGGIFPRVSVVDHAIPPTLGRCRVTPPPVRKNHRRSTNLIDPIDVPVTLLVWVVRMAVPHDGQIKRDHA